jgi:hypothetical protein
MINIINDQSRYIELLKERQKIIKELKQFEVASTISLNFSRENYPVSYEFSQVNEDIIAWLKGGIISSGVRESTTPIGSLYTGLVNTSVSFSTEELNQSIETFFRKSFNIKAKIYAIDRAHFKIFIP